MKRPKIASAVWHVLARGARRLEIIRDGEDADRFLQSLRRAAERWGITVHAYALLSNHYHLLATASSRDLGAFMKSLNQSYSRRYNDRYGQTGHLLDGPYKAFAQPSKWWSVRTSIYIHRNPVVAGIVKRPQDHEWSSYRTWIGGDPGFVRPLLGDLSPKEYRVECEQWKDVPKKPAVTAEQIWEDQARWIFESVRETAADPGHDPRAGAAWLARQAGVPLRAIARALGFSDANYTNVVVHRTSRRIKEDHKLGDALERVLR